MSEQKKYVWTTSGTLTEYGASLLSTIPTLEHRSEFLLKEVARLNDLITDLLKPKAEQLIKIFLKTEGKVVYRRFTNYYMSCQEQNLRCALYSKWQEMVQTGQIATESVKTPRGGHVRYYWLAGE